nr:MAG TPA: hypothetical protein [Caudoviricetes sp.]
MRSICWSAMHSIHWWLTDLSFNVRHPLITILLMIFQVRAMKILDLVVRYKWYDMEESGEKPEEYRVLSDHWVKRFLRIDTGREGALRYLASLPTNQVWQEYTHVRLHRGYTSTTMLFEIKSMHIDVGNPDWGAPKEEVFIIKLGERV